MNDQEYIEKVRRCVSFLEDALPCRPEIIIQLGTGLGGFAERVQAELTLPYDDIPEFPRATVDSHAGNLIVGTVHDRKVAILQGRFHYYEGYSTKEVAFPVRVLSLLGAGSLIVTNAAGGLNPSFEPGSIMILRDHLNFLGDNPLRGANVDDWGPRFPDLSQPYSAELMQAALDGADACGVDKVNTGVYVCIPGPSLETPAETRFLRQAGADAVGMSSIPEVLVARHGGLDVLGLSVISNVNDPDNFQPIILEDIVEAANRVVPQLERLILETIGNL